MKITSSLRLITLARFASAWLATCVMAHAQDLDLALPDLPSAVPASTPAGNPLAPVESFITATRPSLSYSYAEVNGLLSAPGVRNDTSVQTASVTLSTQLIERVLLQYQPMWVAYSNDAFDDTLSHSAFVEATQSLTDWTVRLRHRYYRSSVPLLETGRQTKLEVHATTAEAQRPLGEKTTLDLRLHQNLRSVERFSDYREWISDNAVHYRFSSVITTSAELAYGYIEVDRGPDMSYQQYRGRLRWQPTQIIQMDLRAGLESRTASGGAMGRTTTPVYGGTILYSPGDTTTVRLIGDRQQMPSLAQNQLVRTTAWRAEITQRLLGRIFLTVGWNDRTRSYRPTTANLPTQREDHGRGYQVALGTTLLTRGTVAVFYQENRNRSSNVAFNSNSTRAGIELRYRF